LSHDIHFWLGARTSQDEAGTAAYKTVELDDYLGGSPVQHREVEGHESKLFLDYFVKFGGMHILEGGVASGFRHVTADALRPRLLWVKGRKHVRVLEVDLSYKSMNSGDVFICDRGDQILQWNGSKAGPQEKNRGAQLARAMADERKNSTVAVFDETDKDTAQFFQAIGGVGPVSADTSVADDEAWEKTQAPKLFRLHETNGKFTFTLTAEGQLNSSMLESNDVFILDVGAEIFVWVGHKASVLEKKNFTALCYGISCPFQTANVAANMSVAGRR